MLWRTALALSTLSLAVSACDKQRIAVALPIPPERMDCQAATGKRPKIAPEFAIDWTKILTIPDAKRAFDNYVLVQHGREKTVSTYVLQVEGDLFQCANDAAWLREREAGIAP